MFAILPQPNPVVYALAGVVFLAGNAIAIRAMMKGEREAWAATAVNGILDSAMMLLLFFLLGTDFLAPVDFRLDSVPQIAWLAMLGATVLYTAITYLMYRSYQNLDAGEVRVLGQISIPWTIILALVVLGESIPLFSWGGIALIFLGIALATYGMGFHGLRMDGLKVILLNAFLFGFASLADKFAIGFFPPIFYGLPMFLAPALFAISVALKKKRSIMAFARRKFAPALVIAFTNVLGYFFMLVSYRELPLAIATTVIGTNVLLTIAAGALLFNEKERWRWKLAGAMVAFAGVALIAA